MANKKKPFSEIADQKKMNREKMCEVFVNKVKVKKRSFSAKNVPFGSNILRKGRKQKKRICLQAKLPLH